MMTPLYKKYEIFLRYITRVKPDTRKEFIRASSNEVIKAIVEIAFNILKGTISLTELDRRQLSVYKPVIKHLISKQLTLDEKRSILQENTKLLKKILDIVLR